MVAPMSADKGLGKRSRVSRRGVAPGAAYGCNTECKLGLGEAGNSDEVLLVQLVSSSVVRRGRRAAHWLDYLRSA